MNSVPYQQIQTLFLDAGNTIISMDFDWIIEELKALGLETSVDALRRAEAASRPAVSKELARLGSTEKGSSFVFYVRAILRNMAAFADMDAARLEEAAQKLAGALKKPVSNRRLWTGVMPNAPRALRKFRELGLRIVVVSNSDGSIEALFRKMGLRDLVDLMVDSGVVGYEKPDPRIFEHALRAGKAAPERTLHVGDFYDVDVVGARAAGIHALLLDPFDDWKGADCERLPDLLALANRIKRGRP